MPDVTLAGDGPIFARLDSRCVVVMHLNEYRELLTAASSRVREAANAGRVKRRADQRGHSTIDRDPEVAAFLRERFPRRETISVLYAACVERFGPERAPSAGRIQTLRGRWRR
ncbi:hypothetical protein [Methylobacterium sp. sgz302541]|uniref:hypothetical protein n=1 Tax=unclassified Methylobacterium TaxID=2615210 RepID=UPI003D3271C7